MRRITDLIKLGAMLRPVLAGSGLILLAIASISFVHRYEVGRSAEAGLPWQSIASSFMTLPSGVVALTGFIALGLVIRSGGHVVRAKIYLRESLRGAYESEVSCLLVALRVAAIRGSVPRRLVAALVGMTPSEFDYRTRQGLIANNHARAEAVRIEAARWRSTWKTCNREMLRDRSLWVSPIYCLVFAAAASIVAVVMGCRPWLPLVIAGVAMGIYWYLVAPRSLTEDDATIFAIHNVFFRERVPSQVGVVVAALALAKR